LYRQQTYSYSKSNYYSKQRRNFEIVLSVITHQKHINIIITTSPQNSKIKTQKKAIACGKIEQRIEQTIFLKVTNLL